MYVGYKKNLKNQGAWLYAYPHLKSITPEQINLSYHGRIKRAAPAEGDGEIHKLVQSNIIKSVLKTKLGKLIMPEVKVPELAESITEGPLQNGLKCWRFC